MSIDPTIEYLRFKWLVEGKIAGGTHPDLSHGLEAVAPFLRRQGIGAIVTLYDRSLEPHPEDLGFQYLFVETPNYRPPPDLRHIVAFIDAHIRHGQGVLVHCFAGIGRTGTVLAAWLLDHDHGLLAAQALSRVREEYIPEYARSRFPEDPSQVEAIEQFARARQE